VTLNALILYWVSSGAPSDSVDHFTVSTVSMVTGSRWGLEESSIEKNTTGSNAPTLGDLSLTTIASLQTHDIDVEEQTSTQRSMGSAMSERNALAAHRPA
ncbi:hypothetical protein V5O48_017756, partial [Marasmius crinis-equi]